MKVVLFLTVLLAVAQTICTDKPQCFVKRFFQFQYPSQGLYPLSTFQYPNSSIISFKAYGDFNNDLITDIAALQDDNKISIMIWNESQSLYKQQALLNSTDCIVRNIYLYDINTDGYLDVTVWGENPNSTENCLIPYFQTEKDNQFVIGHLQIIPKTTDPILMSSGQNNGPQKITGLLIFKEGKRSILKYESFQARYTNIEWFSLFNDTAYEAIPFSNPHWNSFIDITGDCRSDLILCDNDRNIEFWVFNGTKFLFHSKKKLDIISSLSFADMNYDGSIDMITMNEQKISVYFNKRYLSQTDDFCCQSCKSVTFLDNATLTFILNPGQIFPQNMVHLNDIDIDGYPDILTIYTDIDGKNKPIVIQNKEGNSFSPYERYNSILRSANYSGNVVSVSFLDILQNGILDIVVGVQDQQYSFTTYVFYNNYLFQNYFFIKGYGAVSEVEDKKKGTQLTGVSFYWVNSIGDSKRVAYVPQIIQTAYGALQLPFAICGLGRANNYVETFTFGLLGQSSSWTPIIPNSQLAVFAKGADPSEWTIRIFVLPTQSLVYVVIVSCVILGIWGIVLIILKYKAYRKREESNDQFIH